MLTDTRVPRFSLKLLKQNNKNDYHRFMSVFTISSFVPSPHLCHRFCVCLLHSVLLFSEVCFAISYINQTGRRAVFQALLTTMWYPYHRPISQAIALEDGNTRTHKQCSFIRWHFDTQRCDRAGRSTCTI